MGNTPGRATDTDRSGPPTETLLRLVIPQPRQPRSQSPLSVLATWGDTGDPAPWGGDGSRCAPRGLVWKLLHLCPEPCWVLMDGAQHALHCPSVHRPGSDTTCLKLPCRGILGIILSQFDEGHACAFRAVGDLLCCLLLPSAVLWGSPWFSAAASADVLIFTGPGSRCTSVGAGLGAAVLLVASSGPSFSTQRSLP